MFPAQLIEVNSKSNTAIHSQEELFFTTTPLTHSTHSLTPPNHTHTLTPHSLHTHSPLPPPLDNIDVADAAERIRLQFEMMNVSFGGDTAAAGVAEDGQCLRDLDVPVGPSSEPVMALLTEDGEWHEAVVLSYLGPDRFSVRFVQFNKVQETSRDGIVLMEDLADNIDDDASSNSGCEMCERQMRLTRHHLIPRTMHTKYARMGHSKEHLATTISICRACHSVVHRLYPVEVLAASFHTLELILQDASVQKWIAYARTSKKETKWDSNITRMKPGKIR